MINFAEWGAKKGGSDLGGLAAPIGFKNILFQ